MKMMKIDLISEDKLSSMASIEKIRYILDGVKLGKIIVVEGGLTAEEQMKLIEMTMMEIDENFSGVEIGSYPTKRGFFRIKRRPGMTVVGPADKMTIKKEKELMSAIISF